MGHAQTGRDLADGQPLRPQLPGPLDPLLPPTLSRRDRPGQPAKHPSQSNQLPRRRPWSAGRPAGQDRCRPDRPRTGPRPRPAAASPPPDGGAGRRTARRSRARVHSRPPEPASTGATSRDGRGRGNRLGAAVGPAAARSAPRGGQAAREPIGGWGHPPRPQVAKGISRRRFHRPRFWGFSSRRRAALWPVTSRSRCGERAVGARQSASDGLQIPVSRPYTRSRSGGFPQVSGLIGAALPDSRGPGLCSRPAARPDRGCGSRSETCLR